MPDVFSTEKRSEVMSKIRNKGNRGTEIALINIFRAFHITGWRRNQKVFGKPDFVFWTTRIAVFVDGCFWHGCPQHYSAPKNNSQFWADKINKNKARDEIVNLELQKRNWKVIRIWEHDLKNVDYILGLFIK